MFEISSYWGGHSSGPLVGIASLLPSWLHNMNREPRHLIYIDMLDLSL